MKRAPGRSHLLVSVRSSAEALTALDGGADLIDVKEPSRGSLGAADASVIAEVIEVVRGRVPVSAAMGEWVSRQGLMPGGLSFAKWGLSGVSDAEAAALQIRATPGVGPVLVAYADNERANSPPVAELVSIACGLRFPAFLIDTGIKDGRGLLTWLSVEQLGEIREKLTAAEIPLALAGSLDVETIGTLFPVAPAWFAVRGAACVGGRQGTISTERVRRLRKLIASD